MWVGEFLDANAQRKERERKKGKERFVWMERVDGFWVYTDAWVRAVVRWLPNNERDLFAAVLRWVSFAA